MIFFPVNLQREHIIAINLIKASKHKSRVKLILEHKVQNAYFIVLGINRA